MLRGLCQLHLFLIGDFLLPGWLSNLSTQGRASAKRLPSLFMAASLLLMEFIPCSLSPSPWIFSYFETLIIEVLAVLTPTPYALVCNYF